ncbi:MAG: hypothetical protein F9B45_18000 [Phycisphaera sp. RhM]|nr:hypothetical protein [Phycisphaera sp. RhM]
MRSEESAEDRNRKTTRHWIGIAEEVAKRQRLLDPNSPKEPFKLHEQAIFRHTQSVRGDDIGAVYLWTAPSSDRPAAVGVFFAWSQGRMRNVMEEFHSFHNGPIRREADGHPTWNCPDAGLQWNRSNNLPAPASDIRRVKLQARQFPRGLSVKTTTSEGQSWELRSVPKPFYEYTDADAGIDYGAIFGFCQGTDTELLVAIEARSTDDQPAWYYALAPFTDYQISVDLPDGTTWTSPDGEMGENGKPHFWGPVESRPKPEFER